MSTISPPPWTFDSERGSIHDANTLAIVILRTEVADANGPLVAAAPDLQAALRELVARIEKLQIFLQSEIRFGPRITLDIELTSARAALAKSEGKP